MMKRFLSALYGALPLALAFTLAGCGGGSSSSSSSSTDSTSVPTISTQPSSQSAVVGNSVTFTVVATGSGTLSYQWRKGGSSISGATSSTYVLSSVTSSDAGSYDVVVSNSNGSVTSSTATLTVTTSDGTTVPSITTQPTSQAVAVGGSFTLSVVASGTATLSYQWYKDGTAISGATSASYTVSSATTSDAGSYTVTVSNSAGTVTSDAATITVSSSSSSSSALAASVTTAAQTFYNTLSSSQQSSVQLTWSLDTARKWSNLPAAMVARNGVALSALSTAQKTAANSLISTALSSTGYTLWQGLLAADDYLYSIGGGSSYGDGNYYIAFIGTPSSTDFWVLQLTGHHLTYNLAFNGTTKGPTPMFLGIEPRTSFTINSTTYDPMSAQRTAVSSLVTALASYSAAKLSGTYSDLLFGANGSGSIDGTYPKSYPTGTSGRGVLYSALSTTDQALVKAVIQAYIDTQATEYEEDLSSAYLSDTALASTYVAYAGSGDVTTAGSYVRVDGPRVWIEFSVQTGVIIKTDTHYHTIFRDKTGDYGGKCCS